MKSADIQNIQDIKAASLRDRWLLMSRGLIKLILKIFTYLLICLICLSILRPYLITLTLYILKIIGLNLATPGESANRFFAQTTFFMLLCGVLVGSLLPFLKFISGNYSSHSVLDSQLRQVEKHYLVNKQSLKGDLLSAYQLSQSPRNTSSQALQDAHIRFSLEEYIQKKSVVKAISFFFPYLKYQLSIFLSSVIILAALSFNTAFMNHLGIILKGYNSSRQALHVVRPSFIDKLEFEIEYPSYMRRKKEIISSSNGDLTLPLGSKVHLSAEISAPFHKAELIYNANKITLEKDAHVVFGDFIVSDAGSYHFEMMNNKGQHVKDTRIGSIKTEKDLSPKIIMIAPLKDQLVMPNETIQFAFEAEDDYGLEAIELVAKIQNSTQQESRILVSQQSKGLKKSIGEVQLSLAKLMARPGDKISLHFEAHDARLYKQEIFGRSQTRVLTLFSKSEHQKQLINLQEQVKDALTDKLANDLEFQAFHKSPVFLKIKQCLTELPIFLKHQGQMKADDLKFIVQLTTLIKHIETAEKNAELTAQERNIQQAFLSMQNEISAFDAKVQTSINTIEKKRDSKKKIKKYVFQSLFLNQQKRLKSEEKHVLYLDDLMTMQSIHLAEQLNDEIQQLQNQLKELIHQYKKNPNDQLLKEIKSLLERLKTKKKEMSSHLKQIQKELPDEFLNKEAFKKSRDLNDTESLNDLLNEGKIDDLLEKLEKMQEQNTDFNEELSEQSKEFGQSKYAKISQKLHQVYDSLDENIEKQEALLKESQEITEKVAAKQLKKMLQTYKKNKTDLIQKSQAIVKYLDEINPKEFFPHEVDNLRYAKARSNQLLKDLNNKDLNEAKLSSRESLHYIEKTDNFIADRVQGRFGNKSRTLMHAKENLEEALVRIQEISDYFKKLEKKKDVLFSKQEQEQLQQNGKRQQKLAEKSQEIIKKMDDIDKKTPLFGDEAKRDMRQSIQIMKNAAKQHQQKEFQKGKVAQQLALDKMRKLQNAMQKMQSSSQKQGMPMPMPPSQQGEQKPINEKRSQEKVHIPSADEFKASKEFRRNILDAMQEQAPQQFKEEVKEYYEELIK